MFDNPITANKKRGRAELSANRHTGSINWNGSMIKNPINHAGLMDGKMYKNVGWPSKWNLFFA